jgi:hypothetical protein
MGSPASPEVVKQAGTWRLLAATFGNARSSIKINNH